MRRTHRIGTPFLLALTGLGGCASLPTADDLRSAPAQLVAADGIVDVTDGRARFRQILCAAASGDEAPACGDLLWRLPDETALPGEAALAPLPPPDRYRILIVPGAFSDCFGKDAVAFGDAVDSLASRGYAIGPLPVSGRSGSAHNARMIAEAIRTLPEEGPGRIILVGYSKGTTDILEFLAAEPGLASRVAAVISVAGPVLGSPMADSFGGFYDALLDRVGSDTCDPGDGKVVDSLRPAVRRAWLAGHQLPDTVRYYSLVAFTDREGLATVMRPSWEKLAKRDRRNDGQVTARDAVIPGSTLLGYANGDHWGIAIAVERSHPHLVGRNRDWLFPRDRLLAAMLSFVHEDLSAHALEGATRRP